MTGRVQRRGQRSTPIPGEVWVLVAGAFVIAIGFGLVSPVLPEFARSFNVGIAAATAVVAAFSFFRLVFAPAGGALVTRLGERPIYLTGVLIVAASSFATAFSQSYVQLLVFRGLGGIGSAMFTVSAMALLVRLAPAEIRGRVTSAYASAFLIGGMLGPVLGGFLAVFGLRVPFIVYAGALVLAALVVGVRLSGARLRSSSDGEQTPPMPLREALRSSTYRAALASGFANGWTNFGVRMALLPLLAGAISGDTWVAGVTLTCAAVGTAAALQVGGRATDRFGRRPLVIAGLVVSAVGMAALGYADGLVMLFAMSAVSGLGAGLLAPGQQAAVADLIGRERSGGSVLAAFQMARDSGGIAGSALSGLIAGLAGYGPAFVVTGLVALVAVLPWLWARETMGTTPDTADVEAASPGTTREQ